MSGILLQLIIMNNHTGTAEQDEKVEHLHSAEAIKKIKELTDKSNMCFFNTEVSQGQSIGTRPMSVLQVDELGNLWFLSPKGSDKNKEIAANPSVKLYFQGSKADYLYLEGKASISEDKSKIKELWGPLLKTWFTEGENDPRISVIKVTPAEGYYWDTQHGNVVATIKMMIGAVVGKTFDDSAEGKLKV
jgi:general stress protein 26